MELLRLSGRKVCEQVKNKGALWKGRHMQARWLKGHPRNQPPPTRPALYVGTIASSRLDSSAVRRNRMRRRCREALRLTMKRTHPLHVVSGLQHTTQDVERGPGGEDFQLLLLPRSSSLTCAFDELLLDASRLLSTLSP